MEYSIDTALLFDFYSALLTDKQRSALHMHLELDYSLSEIAENTGVTRQAAQDAIRRGVEQLSRLEDALGLCRRYVETLALLDRIEDSARDAETIALAGAIRKVWEA